MSRYRTLLSLGAVVLSVGMASLIATGAIRRAPPPPQLATPIVMPSPSRLSPLPTPPSCATDQLELVGFFNDCALNAANNTPDCSVSGDTLSDVLHLHGKTHDYLLYLDVTGYHGPGTYANSTVSVMVSEPVMVRRYATGALWRSIPGVVFRVSGADGRTGTVKAALSYVGGEPFPPTVGLNISGPWRCL
jgi:hypothetical protein